MASTIELRFDGLFRKVGTNNKSGVMAYAWLLIHREVVIGRGYGVVAGRAEATSNVAEYLAMIDGLRALVDMGLTHLPIRVIGDSKIVIAQMSGKSAIHADGMRELHGMAMSQACRFEKIQYEWTKRAKNKEADLLSRHALRQARRDPNLYNSVMAKLRNPVSPRKRRSMERFLPLVEMCVFRPVGLGG